MLTDWHEFEWYLDGDDTAEHDPVWIEPGTIFEVYSLGQLNMDEPYYTFELSHHIHGDITIDVGASGAEKIFALNERADYRRVDTKCDIERRRNLWKNPNI